MRCERISFNKNYNIIKIYGDKIVEFFLEKIGYADLRHLVGV